MAGLCGLASPGMDAGKNLYRKIPSILEAHHATAETHPHAGTARTGRRGIIYAGSMLGPRCRRGSTLNGVRDRVHAVDRGFAGQSFR